MTIRLRCLLIALLLAVPAAAGETVRLKATADVWLSDANDNERNSSGGKNSRFKLKSIQEMAAIRFDAAPAKGREVVSAKLFLKPDAGHQLRYIRLSTINQNWEEGNTGGSYGPGDGATFNFADHASKRAWAWPGSQFCDSCLSAGNTLSSWAELKKEDGGWVSVSVAPELIYALAVDDTDGLAVQDGGTIALHNNMVHSCQSKGNEPYIEAIVGAAAVAKPAPPAVKIEAAPERAHLTTGAIKLTIDEAKDVFCWRIMLNGKPVERWRVKHPVKKGPTVVFLEDLAPAEKCELEVRAVAASGAVSEAFKATVNASPALPMTLELAKLEPSNQEPAKPLSNGKIAVVAIPPLVKFPPDRPATSFGESKLRRQPETVDLCNAITDGTNIQLAGARGECVAFQLCIENQTKAPIKGITVKPTMLEGAAGAKIAVTQIEMFKNWYALNKNHQWQPAYAVPIDSTTQLEIPDPARGKVKVTKKEKGKPDVKEDLALQQLNQTVTVEIFIPTDAKASVYVGTIMIAAEGADPIGLNVQLQVFDFTLPDKLSFWPELNAYNIPRNAHAYYKLAHQNRCVLNLNAAGWAPKLQGSGKDIKVLWDEYDKNVGPLLSGELFKTNRRAGVPLECMYLPYFDSWPTPLTKETYNYPGHWPGRGEDRKFLHEHYMTAPYIGDALSQSYKDAFVAVEKQFIAHFKEKGWNSTEMQCFFGGKNTHRIDYGSNMWWTTDEPYHWDDWLALHFFDKLFTENRGDGDPKIWVTRADISRPNWQGRVMEGVLDKQYGGFGSAASLKRLRLLRDDCGIRINNYGSANADNTNNTGAVALLLGVWVAGGDAHLPWQTLGGDAALDVNDTGTGGNALLVPGTRFGLEVVGDLRLKALREGQQVIEYLTLLAAKHNLQREQVAAMVQKVMPFSAGRKAGANADNADAVEFSDLKAWQIVELRKSLAKLIEGK